MKPPLIPLILAWAGYFSPWLWPLPAALRLSGYDLVEWLTFAQSVRDGTYPITRVDMLWPLIGIALLTALSITNYQLPTTNYKSLISNKSFIFSLLFALFAAFLILPGYPFILTAHTDPELRPQLIAGLLTGLAVLLAAGLAIYRPALAEWLSLSISLIALAATLRAYALARQPTADIFTKPAPVGFGLLLTVAGFGWLAAQCLTRLWRNGRMPTIQTRV